MSLAVLDDGTAIPFKQGHDVESEADVPALPIVVEGHFVLPSASEPNDLATPPRPVALALGLIAVSAPSGKPTIAIYRELGRKTSLLLT
jgi:hypothetical protein